MSERVFYVAWTIGVCLLLGFAVLSLLLPG